MFNKIQIILFPQLSLKLQLIFGWIIEILFEDGNTISIFIKSIMIHHNVNLYSKNKNKILKQNINILYLRGVENMKQDCYD